MKRKRAATVTEEERKREGGERINIGGGFFALDILFYITITITNKL